MSENRPVKSFRPTKANEEYLDQISWGKRGDFINTAIDKLRSEEEQSRGGPGETPGETPHDPGPPSGESPPGGAQGVTQSGENLEAPVTQEAEGDFQEAPPARGRHSASVLGTSKQPSGQPDDSNDSTPTSNDSESPSSETASMDEGLLKHFFERLRATNGELEVA